MTTNTATRWLLALLFLAFPMASGWTEDFDSEDCMLCHEDPDEVPADRPGLLIFAASLEHSIHAELACTDCHEGIEDLPHEEEIPKVDCAWCHDDVAEIYDESLHGVSVADEDPLAPRCSDCHGKHDIKAHLDPESRTNPIHIARMCGACHAEDAPVARDRAIDQHNILKNYEESIHGEGVQKKGLTVTAVCTSCHTAHHVLPHTDERSSIHKANVVGTCLQCHALIEEVHRKVIEGELWEKDPSKVPLCIDCHQPHEARKVYYDEGVSDKDCMACHNEEVQDGSRVLAAVDHGAIAESTHGEVRCAQCHTGADPALRQPCEPVSSAVDCSICHAEEVAQHEQSIHGRLMAEGDPDAPKCLDCHTAHDNKGKADPSSPTYPRNVPNLCGRCHREGEKAAARYKGEEHDVLKNYGMSIHGKGLIDSGLVVTAMCSDCHGAHTALPESDPNSTVHPSNIAATCGNCHHGIEEVFNTSIHSASVSQTDEELPVCSSCHSAHSISRTDQGDFKLGIMRTCGQCHEEVTATYFETFHGKASNLDAAGTAKCHDCHGAHDVLPTVDPKSRLSRDNIVETCAECHPGSHRRFAGYLTHATHHDPDKYPILFWAFWGMTALLVGTFSFFGIHTLLWVPRSIVESRRKRTNGEDEKPRMIMRFDRISRQMHFVLILSFIGLALTGMTLKFSYLAWAQWLSKFMGGFETMGEIHRICAVVMFLDFAVHLFHVFSRKRKSGTTWKQLVTGTRTLVPTFRDVREFWQTVKWHLHIGPRPQYGAWTYWEKFDYFAVFWGVFIIGSTGLILWFPVFFTRFLPGWAINVATIIHSDEALLAVGFIFTIHFFNTHFRPDKFPMDTVMFTGSVPEEELKEEKPDFYKELVESGELEKRVVDPPTKEFVFWSRVFGTIALVVGFTLVLFIILSMVWGYK